MNGVYLGYIRMFSNSFGSQVLRLSLYTTIHTERSLSSPLYFSTACPPYIPVLTSAMEACFFHCTERVGDLPGSQERSDTFWQPYPLQLAVAFGDLLADALPHRALASFEGRPRPMAVSEHTFGHPAYGLIWEHP